ncbi:hypothetical protein ACP4OV_029730 [Aristida adscensionis]
MPAPHPQPIYCVAVVSYRRATSFSTPSMAKSRIKIQPLATPSSPSSANEECQGLQREQKQQAVYTVWMKSLLFGGCGCTVYGADGGVAFRVDNYGRRGGREAFVMDLAGNALIRIQRKSFWVFRRWEACRRAYDGGEGRRLGEAETPTRPWFRVWRVGRNGAAVTMHGTAGRTAYRIDRRARKSEYRISGADGGVVAAIARKQTACGVVLGEDVLTLTVGPEVDHLLVLGLVTVFGLMNRSM